MASSYIIETNIGKVRYVNTACYADFYHLVQSVHSHKWSCLSQEVLKRKLSVATLPNKIYLTKMWLLREKGDLSLLRWKRIHKLFSEFSATSPYILPYQLGDQRIGIDLRQCPTHVGYFIMWMFRLFDEKYGKAPEQALYKLSTWGVNKVMTYLFLIDSYCSPERLQSNNYGTSIPIAPRVYSHSIAAFDGYFYNISKTAIQEMLSKGSLDFFIKNWKSHMRVTFNHARLGAIREVSDAFSPFVNREDTLCNCTRRLPSEIPIPANPEIENFFSIFE